MAKNDVALHRAVTIFSELDQVHSEISMRAYELFRHRGDGWGSPAADWLNAERDLIWRPAIELRRKNGAFEVVAATPGVDARELDVRITTDDLLIKANVHHQHTAEEGDVQVCELNAGELFRSVHFPEKVDPATATAAYRNGMLRVTAPIAKPSSDDGLRARNDWDDGGPGAAGARGDAHDSARVGRRVGRCARGRRGRVRGHGGPWVRYLSGREKGHD